MSSYFIVSVEEDYYPRVFTSIASFYSYLNKYGLALYSRDDDDLCCPLTKKDFACLLKCQEERIFYAYNREDLSNWTEKVVIQYKK